MLSGRSWEKGELLRNGNFEDGLRYWNVQTKGKAGVLPGKFKTIKGVAENRVAEFVINGPGVAKICQVIEHAATPGLCYELSFFIRNAANNLTGPGIFGVGIYFADESDTLLDMQLYGISNPSRLLVWTYHFLVSNEAPPETQKIKIEMYGKVKDPGSVLHLLVDEVELKTI